MDQTPEGEREESFHQIHLGESVYWGHLQEQG